MLTIGSWKTKNGGQLKARLVPATNELMVELTNYRCWLGLPPLPQQGEPSTLLLPVWWRVPDLAALPAARSSGRGG
ncbi:hypothetical protein [Aquabacterium humicola]|uniref:hypothetical protein n=1 Tax=Aquabacterium humicola TaxID=3237377 RepID=UPI0025429746|nr:hypothetical protein [Rubrivivax pictus]